jgi:tetratricopeptide (TPR) repeat protein
MLNIMIMTMKKIFLFFAAAFMAAGVASAQDINKAIELANNGNEAFQLGEYQLALDAFKQSLAIAEGLGEAGAEHAGTCKTAICTIYLANAKNLLKAGDYDGALAKLNETVTTAEGYGATETVSEAQELIPNVYMAQGNAALKAKDMASAVAAYTKVTELNPANGDAYLRLGRAFASTGKVNEAVAAYEKAAANGEEADAKKQLSNLYLKLAQAAAKAKDNKGTIDNALKANEYLENANAYKLAASAAQKMGNNAQCIEFYEKYLAVKPNAKDAAGVTFTIAALYQQIGNKAKAIENYTKVASDPQYGAGAQEQLKVLK